MEYKNEYLCVGVGSLQENKKHSIFLDLDNHTEQEATHLARFLINNHCLSDCYIVKSSEGNHHLVCFDLLDFDEVEKIANKHGHKQWAKFRGRSGDFVLRISPKLKPEGKTLVPIKGTEPELVAIVKSPFNFNEKSNGLRIVFSSKWGIMIEKDDKFVGKGMARLHIYRLRMKEKIGEKNVNEYTER